MLPRSGQLLQALVCLCLYLNLVGAGLVNPVRRDDRPPATTSLSPSPTDGGDGGQTTSLAPTITASGDPSSSSSSVTTNSTSTTVSSVSPVPTLVNGTDSLNHTLFNTTIAAGELPLAPIVTPGWAVAGVIMLVTGAVYALVGIRTRWLHTYFSTAYLASLSTTVLIVYVMTPPVSNTIQGAYVAAVVMTGLILGGGAIVFKEITEGLGCLLGGFCLSMWLLCLKEGGLLPGTSAKVTFIACFTAGAFAFYFSHYTRTYALMGCISFSGATVAVLGIDCFSRAGLKEFWVYIWNLNDNLFPLGADTYPLTKGIRVELAVTIIVCLAGIVSQLKLWRIIKERRARRDAERAEGERNLQQEEESAGRQIEEANARERREWEAAYGDGEVPPPRSPDPSADSGVGDMESEKRIRHSHGTVTSRSPSQSQTGEPIEMANLSASETVPALPSKPRAAAEVMMTQSENDRMVTVRVARDDDLPQVPVHDQDCGHLGEEEQKEWIIGADGEARRASKYAKRNSGAAMSTGSPEIVPLPFRVPVGHDQEELDDGDRSSFATIADEDDALSAALSRRSSLAKRLSQGSMDLLRSLSQRSKRATVDRTQLPGESREELVTSRASEHDDNGSVAATIDGMSSEGDDGDTIRDSETSRDIEIRAQLGGIADEGAVSPSDKDEVRSPPFKNTAPRDLRRVSATETTSTDMVGASETGQTLNRKSYTSEATELAPPKTDATTTETTAERERSSSSREGTKKAKSVASSADSAPASLTKERLPRSLSRIALSYRTNEWAKHLTNAEIPEQGSLQLSEYPETPAIQDVAGEEAAPVNVAELQQTAENAAPPPRSSTAMSNYAHGQPSPVQALSRSNSRQSITYQSAAAAQTQDVQARNIFPSSSSAPTLSSPTSSYQDRASHAYRSMSGTANRRMSSGLLHQSIAEENDGEQQLSASPLPFPEDGGSSGVNSVSPSPIPPDPSTSTMSLAAAGRPPVPGVVSYSSPQTLLGRREMLLRSKSQASFVAGTAAPPESPFAMPTIASQPGSEAGSLHNYPIYSGGTGPSSATASPVDLDDLPMSQRRELMRQSSQQLGRSPTPSGGPSRPTSGIGGIASAGSVPAAFDSHQPKRGSHLPPAAVREAQLANFRTSVAADLRAGSPVVPTGRETPLVAAAGSTNSLLLLATAPSPSPSPYGGGGLRDSDVRRSIDAQRSYLLGQREAEAQLREVERLEREQNDRAFEERMRRGDLLEAHRDAMRRMQAGARGR